MKHLRRTLTILGLAAAAAVPLMLMGSASAATPTPATPSTVTLKAGGMEGLELVNLYLPNAVTVHTGDIVKWTVTTLEPHSITFGPPPAGDPTEMPDPFPAQPVAYDGTGSINTGLIGPAMGPTAPTSFEVKFTKAGSYAFSCVIHPNMTGTVTVVDSGTVSKQADLDAAGAATYATELAALKAAVAQNPATAPSTTNADGSKDYHVVVGTDTQNGTAFSFFPPTVNVTQGDSVTWTSNVFTPHTVTFGFPPVDPSIDVNSIDVDMPYGPTGPYDGKALVHSGIIGNDFPAGKTFTLTFNTPGTYRYICVIHVDEQGQGMSGDVVVAAKAAPPPTSTPAATPTTAPKPPATGSGNNGGDSFPWLLAGIAGLLFIASGATILATRQR